MFFGIQTWILLQNFSQSLLQQLQYHGVQLGVVLQDAGQPVVNVAPYAALLRQTPLQQQQNLQPTVGLI